MKEQKLYICDVCGGKYSNEKDCMICEHRHKQNLIITGKKYLPVKGKDSGMPVRISVKSEGDDIAYTYRIITEDKYY